MDSLKLNSRTKKRGDEIILQAYNHIRENGSATAQDLCALTGCDMQTVGSPRIMRFNEYMRDNRLPHLFTVTRGGKNSGPVTWSIREKK